MKSLIKRIVTLLSCCCMILPLCLTLTACGHTHEYDPQYRYNNLQHWRICTTKDDCDSVINLEPHTMGEWQVESPKTCTTDEIKFRTCECGYKETTTGAEKGHRLTGEKLFDDNYHWDECSGCNEKVNKTPHTNDAKNICSVCHHGAIVRIEQTYFATIADAIDSITNDDKQTTIVLLKNTEGKAVKVPSGKNIVFDLRGYTYTITQPAVGSTGTTTSGFQLLKNSTITFLNGTIKHNTSYTEQQDDLDVQILINNYANLTLNNITLVGTSTNPQAVKGTCLYTLSNNNGKVRITGNSHIIADEVRDNGTGGVAFDLWYSNSYPGGISVTFDNNFTGSVRGKVEYGAHKNAVDWESKTQLRIEGGTFLDFELVYTHKNQETDPSTANIIINKAVFEKDAKASVEMFKGDGTHTREDGLYYEIYIPIT